MRLWFAIIPVVLLIGCNGSPGSPSAVNVGSTAASTPGEAPKKQHAAAAGATFAVSPAAADARIGSKGK